jgi:hypothetical protein
MDSEEVSESARHPPAHLAATIDEGDSTAAVNTFSSSLAD